MEWVSCRRETAEQKETTRPGDRTVVLYSYSCWIPFREVGSGQWAVSAYWLLLLSGLQRMSLWLYEGTGAPFSEANHAFGYFTKGATVLPW